MCSYDGTHERLEFSPSCQLPSVYFSSRRIEVNFRQVQQTFFSPKRRGRLCDLSFLFSGYRGLFLRRYNGGGETTHFHLTPRLEMYGVLP